LREWRKHTLVPLGAVTVRVLSFGTTNSSELTNSGPRLSQSALWVMTTWTLTLSHTEFDRVSFAASGSPEHAVRHSNPENQSQYRIRFLRRRDTGMSRKAPVFASFARPAQAETPPGAISTRRRYARPLPGPADRR
jgi:hypothetical protein